MIGDSNGKQFEKVLKPESKNSRDRLDFASIVAHCPELGNRVAILRSRVRNLKTNFRKDSIWALNRFNCVTKLTVSVACMVAIAGICVALFKSDLQAATAVTAALATIAGSVAAAASAFGYHKRYHAMFRAQWAMAALEVRIDQFLCDIANTRQQGEVLSAEERTKLEDAVAKWLEQLDLTLHTFGDSYGASIEGIKIQSIATQTGQSNKAK